MVRLGGGRFPLPSALRDDILNARRLVDYDVVLYLGSIPWPSHVLARLSGVPVALFLHGLVYHELFHEMLYGAKLKGRAGAAVLTVMLEAAKSFNTIDLYVCHSLTACEANGVSDSFVLLPQWVFRDEVRTSEQRVPRRNGLVRVVTYSSYASSPRLLSASQLLALARLVERKANRRFEVVVVDPRGHTPSFGPVKTVRPMRREEFLQLLASADLFIERCVDEELGMTSLEAMAVGTPVAKLTRPRYWDRQDYGEEDLVLAHSLGELAEKIAEYINYVEHYGRHYSKRCREFVLAKRTWDVVKLPLLTALRRTSRRD